MLIRHSHGDTKKDIEYMSLWLKGEVEVADINLRVIGYNWTISPKDNEVSDEKTHNQYGIYTSFPQRALLIDHGLLFPGPKPQNPLSSVGSLYQSVASYLVTKEGNSKEEEKVNI